MINSQKVFFAYCNTLNDVKANKHHMVVYNHYYASYMFNTYSFPITSFPPTQYSNDVKADSSIHMLIILKYE